MTAEASVLFKYFSYLGLWRNESEPTCASSILESLLIFNVSSPYTTPPTIFAIFSTVKFILTKL